MKIVAILSLIVLLFSVIGVGYLYVSSTVTVTGVGVQAVEASSQQERFNQLQIQLEENCVIGTTFTSQTSLADAENYQFLIYTVRLQNNCRIPAEMVEVQVTPMDNDILQIGDTSLKNLDKKTTGDFQATILTSINMHSVREINITYYMWGIPFHLRTTYGQ